MNPSDGKIDNIREIVDSGHSALPRALRDMVGGWQFLSLLPDPMGRPSPKRLASNGGILLNRDGSNLAQYLLNIREKDSGAFDGIVEAMQFVLDYARNFEPVETREIQPTMYLKMLEQVRDEKIEIPSWLISTGTIRILALLAVLRNPDPPPLIVVEEIENGLDPRTIHMVLEEIRTVVQSGQSQVILTTHSPYLLDLLPLQTLILVQRDNGGDPVFWRPSESEEVQDWAKSFAPGQLYTTGRFNRDRERQVISSIGNMAITRQRGFEILLSNGLTWFIRLPQGHEWAKGHTLDAPVGSEALNDYTNVIRNITIEDKAFGKPGLHYHRAR